MERYLNWGVIKLAIICMKNSTLFYKEEFPKQILDCYHPPDKLEFVMASDWFCSPAKLIG